MKATLLNSTTFSTLSHKSTASSSEELKRFISYPILQSSSSPTFSPKSTASSSEELKRFISYPILQSSSSPISPQSSEHSHEEWGKREREEKERERDSISIYGLEEILRLSLCPPHLFQEDNTIQDYSCFSSPSTSNRNSVISSDESVSLSLFDDESLPYHSPAKASYPHQPVVHSSSPSRARLRSHTISTTRSTSQFESEEEGFSFCPTPSSSTLATPVSSPARSTLDHDLFAPSTPNLESKRFESSASSLLFLPLSSALLPSFCPSLS